MPRAKRHPNSIGLNISDEDVLGLRRSGFADEPLAVIARRVLRDALRSRPQVHRAWESCGDDGDTVRVFPLSDYPGETLGEQSKAALADAQAQSGPNTIFVPLYANLRRGSAEESGR